MKRFTLILIAICLVFVVTSCKGCKSCTGDDIEYEDNGEIYVDKQWDIYPTEHTLKEPISISYWSANSAVDVHGIVFAEMIEEFNEYQRTTYPNSPIHVTAAFNGGYAVNNTKLQAGLIGSTNPEIAQVGVSSLALYYDNVIDQRQIFTYDQIREIYPGLLQFAMYRNVFVGYPYFGSTNVLVLNKTLAKATGMTIPTIDDIVNDQENSIWTWEYMYELASKMRQTKTDGTEVYGYAGSGVSMYEVLFTQNEMPYNATSSKTAFTDQGLKNGFQLFRDMVVNDIMKNPVLDPNHATQIQGDFMQGTVGLLCGTSSIVRQIYEAVVNERIDQGQDPLFEVDVLPFPKKTSFYSNQSGGGIVIFNNKSKARTQAAVEFLRWFQAPEQQAKYAVRTGYFPATKEAAETETFVNYKQDNPTLADMLKLMTIELPEGTKLPQGRSKALADTDFGNYSKGIFYDDCSRDMDGVIKEIRERLDYVLAENDE